MKQMFTVNGVTYTQSNSGYFFKTTGKKDSKGNDFTVRIGKAIFEQAFEEYVNQKTDEAEAWEDEMQEAKEKAAKKQAENDKAAEDALNKSTKKTVEIINRAEAKMAKKPRRSKDIAYDSNGVTLTEKQVDFLKEMTKTSFYENGVESSLWCDVLTEEIGGQFGGKPMTVGAMISTLREKDLVVVGRERINGHMAKFMMFTDLGKKVATELGL